MSNQQKSYSYLYLTVTGEGDAHQIIKDYHLTRADAWNMGEVEQERYQFEQMCIRINGQQEDNLYANEELGRFLNDMQPRLVLLLPTQYERTVHLVLHGWAHQGYGFYLDITNIRQLARLNANFQYYGYQQQDDGHDFPYSRALPIATREKIATKRAYITIESTAHSIEQLAAITQLSPNLERSKNRGDIWFKQQPIIEGQLPRRLPTTRFVIDSGIEKGQPLAAHIEAVLAKIAPHYEQFIPLLLDYQVSFGLNGTGLFAMPYQLLLTKEWILQLAKFKCSVDMDLYAEE